MQGEEVEPQEVVFVVEEGKVKEVPVELGISDDNFIEVKDGVQNGATIVTGPYSLLSKRLKEGDEVEESKENKKSRKQNT